MPSFFNHKTFVNLLSVVLLALLAYPLAQLGWQFLETQNKPTDIKPMAMQSQQTSTPTMSHVQLVRAIISQHAFGKVAKDIPVQVVEKEVIKAPETKLNYKLRGLYYSQNASLSSAIIETNNQSALSYQQGNEIESGIKVHDIQLDHVVLDRYGKLEILSLEESKGKLKGSRKSAINIATNSGSNPQHNDILKKYKQRFVNNPMALAKKFRAIPVTENGKNIGFKLKAIRGETLLKKLNVHKDAVFTSINGVGLDQPFQALDALKSLQTASQVTVTYQLNGVEESRLFDL